MSGDVKLIKICENEFKGYKPSGSKQKALSGATCKKKGMQQFECCK